MKHSTPLPFFPLSLFVVCFLQFFTVSLAYSAAPKPFASGLSAENLLPATEDRTPLLRTDILKEISKEGLQEKTAQIATELQNSEEADGEDPWQSAWSLQLAELEKLCSIADEKEHIAPKIIQKLNAAMRPYEQEAQRLFMFSSSYARVPRVLEALQRRLNNTAEGVEKVLSPARKEADDINETLRKMKLTTQVFANEQNPSGELKSIIYAANTAKNKLESVASHLASATTPANTLLQRLQGADQEISTALPIIWENHYLQGPVSYWDPSFWKELPQHLRSSWQVMKLRMPLEFPSSRDAWNMALIRFLAIFLFLSLVAFICYRGLKTRTDNPVIRHLFHVSLPWLILGISIIGASMSSSKMIWYALLGIGNLVLIIGQIFLAWDLRCLDKPQLYNVASPFWQLAPLTLAGYLLIYPSIPLQVLSIAWIVLVLLFFTWRYIDNRRQHSEAYPELAASALTLQPFFLWASLILAIIGLPIYSMILYMLYLSIAVALQLSLGCIHLMNLISANLPKEGIHAAIGNTIIALAAPAVLVLVLGGMSLWVLTLPGGIPLLGYYGFSGVKIGGTSFNIIQLLLIVSAFYLTRTAIQLGTAFLNRLPERGMHMDSSLIPPFKTGLTYAFWALYGLLVLRFLGLELSNLAMVAGGLSVGIGFGMQTIVNNFLSGLILIFSRSLQEGDVIDVNGLVGQVRKISVRATMVETYDSALIYVPNSEFVSNKLINWTRNSRSVRRQIGIGVAYGSDPALVMDSLKEVATENENVLNFPKPSVLFQNFGNSTLDFNLRYWVADYNLGAPIDSEIRLAIGRKFKEKGIEVAFPQLDLHIKSTPTSFAATLQEQMPSPSQEDTPNAPNTPLIAEGAEDGTYHPVAPSESEAPLADYESLEDAPPVPAPKQNKQNASHRAASTCVNKILPRRSQKKPSKKEDNE